MNVTTASGLGKRYEFYPDYCKADFIRMQQIIEDATLAGVASLRLIHDDCITVTTIGA